MKEKEFKLDITREDFAIICRICKTFVNGVYPAERQLFEEEPAEYAKLKETFEECIKEVRISAQEISDDYINAHGDVQDPNGYISATLEACEYFIIAAMAMDEGCNLLNSDSEEQPDIGE